MIKPAITLFAAILAMMTLLSVLSAPQAVRAQSLNLPDIGDSSFAALSKHSEDALGEAFMRSVRNSIPLMTDPIVEEYVQSLGYRLAAHSNNYYRSFYFFVVDSTQINAFAGPGGYIGINSGLILAAKSESEVAAVMAHEIGHVTQRHIARSIEMQKNMSIPSLAALLASMLLATQNTEAGSAAMAATLAGGAQYQINFIRRNEKRRTGSASPPWPSPTSTPMRCPASSKKCRTPVATAATTPPSSYAPTRSPSRVSPTPATVPTNTRKNNTAPRWNSTWSGPGSST
jgi:predicted Zn-dependent protease